MGASLYLLSLEKLINCEVMAKLRFNIYKPKSIVVMKLPDVQQPCTEVPGLFLWQQHSPGCLAIWRSVSDGRDTCLGYQLGSIIELNPHCSTGQLTREVTLRFEHKKYKIPHLELF